ncbi:hypothetical protein GCM10023081_37450 [Arthrobacter ginkgonis]|uniref:LssY-like C-terminal domain-containing protein n=1 Tax=Arthrobacter ginkgonis TaxID=1630594 RepID=A0ABP7CXQ8_9MICC
MGADALRKPRGAREVKAVEAAADRAFFILGGVAALWLAAVLLRDSLQWSRVWFLLVFWLVLAYLALPRLNRVLTRIYLPDYFVGRARTSDGLLGDPVNLALLGDADRIHCTMRRAGWTRADELGWTSSWRIVTATLLRKSYGSAPVSPLFLFGRQQDFAYEQEVDGSPGKRHHIRFWSCPPGWMLPGGIPVDWLAAGTYDRSVGLSLFTLQVTHKVAESIDAERDHVLASLQNAEPGVPIRTIRDFSTGYHSRNGGGDTIETDGNLPIVDLQPFPVPAGQPTEPGSRSARRPAPVVFGSLLVAGRGLAALALAGGVLAPGDRPLEVSLGLPSGMAEALEGLLVPATVVVAAFGAGELLLAWLIFNGRNWARITAMALSAAAIILQATAVLNGAALPGFGDNLVGFSLDVLLLIALSSQRARAFAHRRTRQPGGTLAQPSEPPRPR